MLPQSQLPRVLRFGTFEVDVPAGELRKNGLKLKLQEQPFQVLCMLVEHPGEVVTREELRNRLWPADTFVDFDHGVNAAIKRLRDALGESAETPIFIETLARRGYRFIAPVDGCSAPGGIGIAAAPERGKSSFLRPWVAIAFLLPIVIAVLVWAVWRYPSRHTDIIERKLTSNSSENSVNSAAVSPDGKYLAYADNTGVYLKQIHTGETHSVALPPNFSARVDDWFPDGSRLLVSHNDEPGKAGLWSISVFGGSPRPLADDAFGGSVSPDGAHIAFRRVYTPHGVSLDLGREQWVMRSDGADQVKVAADKSDGSALGAPTWSPDGKRIAYIRTTWTENPQNSSVEVNDWENARAETLFSDGHLTPALHWLPDGLLIYGLDIDGSNRQDSSLWTVSPQKSGEISGSPKRIMRGPMTYSRTIRVQGSILHLTGSTEGKVISFLSEHWSPSVYIGTLAPDGAHLLASRRLTLDESANAPFSWTPDSKAVLFNSDRNGTEEIFKQATDQPLAENLITGAQDLWQPRLTSDSSEILYISTPQSSSPETLSSIFAIPVMGGTPRLVLQDISIWNVQCARMPSTICLYSVVKGDVWKTFRFDVKSGKTTAPPANRYPMQLELVARWLATSYPNS